MTNQRWVSILVATALATGCGQAPHESILDTSAPSPESRPNWPSLLDEFRFHWTAEKGIDVATGPAMVVRAYLEAYKIGEKTLNAENTYPGFTRATPDNQPRTGNYQFQLVDIRPISSIVTATPEDALPRFGFEALHFLELTPIGNGYRAVVCSGDYAEFVASQSQRGKFRSVGFDERIGEPWPREYSGVSVNQVQLTQHDPRVGPSPRAPVTVPQEGPLPAPYNDVFGDWFITGADGSFWGPKDDPKSFRHDLEQRCDDAMPTPKAERLAMMTGFKDQPPPHGEAIPGWPAKAE